MNINLSKNYSPYVIALIVLNVCVLIAVYYNLETT